MLSNRAVGRVRHIFQECRLDTIFLISHKPTLVDLVCWLMNSGVSRLKTAYQQDIVAVKMDFAAMVRNLDDIQTTYKDIKESQCIFEMVNGRETPMGVIQAILQHGLGKEQLERLQSLIIDLAVDITFTQASLVALLDAFYHCLYKDIKDGIWDTFGMNEGDLYSSLMHDESRAEDYININGFEAQLWQTLGGTEVEDLIYSSFIINMARSIEKENLDEGFQKPEVEIAAACLWAIHGGRRAWELSKENGRDEGTKDWCGELWAGHRGYCVERWRFWEMRFGDVAAGKVESVGAETRRLATAAVTNMKAVEALYP